MLIILNLDQLKANQSRMVRPLLMLGVIAISTQPKKGPVRFVQASCSDTSMPTGGVDLLRSFGSLEIKALSIYIFIKALGLLNKSTPPVWYRGVRTTCLYKLDQTLLGWALILQAIIPSAKKRSGHTSLAENQLQSIHSIKYLQQHYVNFLSKHYYKLFLVLSTCDACQNMAVACYEV